MTLVLVLAAGIAFAIWRIQRATPPARRVPVTPTGGATGQECVAPLCCEPATIRLSVGHDYWPLCIGHGLPLLTEGLRA